MKRIFYYFKLYLHILKMTASMVLEYRFNLVVQGMFMIVFIIGQYILIQATFLKTQTIAGWTKDEVMLMFGVFVFMWGMIEFFFFDGLRRFTYVGVRYGEIDKFLTKPLSPQAMISFSSPVPTVLPQQLVALFIVATQIPKLYTQMTPVSVVLFLLFYILSVVVIYLVDSTYATLAFHVDQSTELLRTVQTLTDNSQYPLSIYPQAVKPFLFSVIPIAFISFIPTSFLLNRAPWWFGVWAVVFFLIVYCINRLAWRIGWRKYTSASS